MASRFYCGSAACADITRKDHIPFCRETVLLECVCAGSVVLPLLFYPVLQQQSALQSRGGVVKQIVCAIDQQPQNLVVGLIN